MMEDLEFITGGPYGAFERTYKIRQDLSPDQIQMLIEWLANSLEDNFILIRTQTHTLAGGYSDNYTAWKRGTFQKESTLHISCMYELRIHQKDIPIFEMVWQKNIRKS